MILKMNKKLKIISIMGVLLIGSMPVSAVGLEELIGWALSWIEDVINNFFNLLLGKVVDLLTWNPDITIVKPLMDDFIELATPLYIIAFILIGIYFFFLSESPKGRARARSALLKLLISLAFVITATPIYQFLLDLSELLVNFVMSLVEIDLSITGILALYSVAPLFAMAICFVLLTLLTFFALRYLLLLIMAAIFPLTIFFFFFEFTKDYGRQIMRYTLMLIFVPVLQAIILVFVISSMNTIGSVKDWGNLAGIAITIGGFLMMIAAPWMALGLLKWIGGVLSFAAFTQLAAGRMNLAVLLFFSSGLMMGEGAGAVPLAATFWFIGQLEHKSEEVGGRLYRTRKERIRPREYGGERRTGEGGRGGVRGELRIRPRKPGAVEAGGRTRRGKTRLEDAILAGDRFMEEGYRLKNEGRPGYKERFKTAIDRYEKAMELSERGTEVLSDRKKAELYAKMGEAYEQLDRTDIARDRYKEAMRLDPKNPEYAERLADILSRRG